MELTVRWSTGTLIVAVTTAVLAAGLGTPETPTAPAAGPPRTPQRTPRDSALATSALAALEVHPRAAGGRRYARSWFGAPGDDVDGNGCDTRDDALRRDLRGAAPSGDCAVVGGTLTDPYTGVRVRRRSGTALRVDHVVALADAWTTGAQDLSAAQRRRLANDPLNLVTTTAATAAAKGDADAASWLPPKGAARCGYVARRIAVKQAYRLWVTAVEGAAMERVLATCPDEPLPARQGWPAVGAEGADGPEDTATGPAPTAVEPTADGSAGDLTSDRPVQPTLAPAPRPTAPAPVAVEPTAATRSPQRRRAPATPRIDDPLPTAVLPSSRRA
jgi:Protein of unknown function (DUF1524)